MKLVLISNFWTVVYILNNNNPWDIKTASSANQDWFCSQTCKTGVSTCKHNKPSCKEKVSFRFSYVSLGEIWMTAAIHHQNMTACKLNSRQKCRRKTMATLCRLSSLCTTKDFFVSPTPLFSFCKRSLHYGPLKYHKYLWKHTPHFSYVAFLPPLEFVKRVISLGETQVCGVVKLDVRPLRPPPPTCYPSVTRQHLLACAK